MQRLRTIALVSAWAGLVWMLFARAAREPLFNNLPADLAYNIGVIAIAVVVVVAAVIGVGRLFRPPAAFQLALATLLILALAAVEVFWLRGLIAQP